MRRKRGGGGQKEGERERDVVQRNGIKRREERLKE